MNVPRTNPSLSGMGCPSCGGEADCYMSPNYGYPSAQTDRDVPGLFVVRGLKGLGASATPTDAGPTTAYIQGTAANSLLNATPDPLNPTAQTVMESFSNTVGTAQPGVLQLDPNATANNLSFVQPPVQSTQCKVMQTINSNPIWFVAGTFAVFYLINHHASKRRKA